MCARLSGIEPLPGTVLPTETTEDADTTFPDNTTSSTSSTTSTTSYTSTTTSTRTTTSITVLMTTTNQELVFDDATYLCLTTNGPAQTTRGQDTTPILESTETQSALNPPQNPKPPEILLLLLPLLRLQHPPPMQTLSSPPGR